MPVDYVLGKTQCPECHKHRTRATHTYPTGKRQMRCLSCSHPFVAGGEPKEGAASVETESWPSACPWPSARRPSGRVPFGSAERPSNARHRRPLPETRRLPPMPLTDPKTRVTDSFLAKSEPFPKGEGMALQIDHAETRRDASTCVRRRLRPATVWPMCPSPHPPRTCSPRPWGRHQDGVLVHESGPTQCRCCIGPSRLGLRIVKRAGAEWT